MADDLSRYRAHYEVTVMILNASQYAVNQLICIDTQKDTCVGIFQESLVWHHNGPVTGHYWTFIKTEMLSFRRNFHHWLRRKLSKWQLSVQLVMRMPTFSFQCLHSATCPFWLIQSIEMYRGAFLVASRHILDRFYVCETTRCASDI